jgi:hypothetical protein
MNNEVIIAKVSDYAYQYLDTWMNQNNLDAETALDEILSSLRQEAETEES